MLAPGDWICKGCGDLQFRRNDTCRRCATSRDGVPPATAASRASAGAGGLPPGAGATGFSQPMPQLAGDWNCPACGDLVFSRNLQCRRCGKPRPGTEGMALPAAPQTVASFTAYGNQVDGDWNCTRCGDLQFRRNVQCRKCGQAKPGCEATVQRMRLEGSMPSNNYMNPGKANPEGTAAMQLAMAKMQADLSKASGEKGARKFSDGPTDSRVAPVSASLWRPEALRLSGESADGAKAEEGPTPPEMRTVKIDNVQSKDSIENDVLKVMNFKFGTVASFTVGDNDDGSVHVLVEFESVEASQKALTKQVMKFNGQTWPISSPSGEVVRPQGFSAPEAPKAPRMGNPTGGAGDADDALKFALHGRGGEAPAGGGANGATKGRSPSRSRSRKKKKDKEKDKDRDRDKKKDKDKDKDRDRRRRRGDDDEDSDRGRRRRGDDQRQEGVEDEN